MPSLGCVRLSRRPIDGPVHDGRKAMSSSQSVYIAENLNRISPPLIINCDADPGNRWHRADWRSPRAATYEFLTRPQVRSCTPDAFPLLVREPLPRAVQRTAPSKWARSSPVLNPEP